MRCPGRASTTRAPPRWWPRAVPRASRLPSPPAPTASRCGAARGGHGAARGGRGEAPFFLQQSGGYEQPFWGPYSACLLWCGHAPLTVQRCSPAHLPATTPQVDANLAAADIPQDLFDAIVSADAFEHLKPSPGAALGRARVQLARGWLAVLPVQRHTRSDPLSRPCLTTSPQPQTSSWPPLHSWACSPPTAW